MAKRKESAMDEKAYKKSDIRRITHCTGHLIDYLYRCNRLPLIKESRGPGFPRLYHPDAIQVIQNHLLKSTNSLEY